MKLVHLQLAIAAALALCVPAMSQTRRDQPRPKADRQVQSAPQRIPPPPRSNDQGSQNSSRGSSSQGSNQGQGGSPSQGSQAQGGSQQSPASNEQSSGRESDNRGSSVRFHGPGPHAGDWLRRFGKTPAQEQKKQLESDPKFQELPRERQEQLRDRLEKFNSLPEDRRNRILKRMEIFEHMTPAQQQEAQNIFGRLRDLAPERRQAVRRAARALRGMPPDARDRNLNSDNVRNNFNDQEREILRGLSNLEAPEVDPHDEQ